MFRGPQVLSWSCPKRTILLQRESHLGAFSGHACAGLHGAEHPKNKRNGGLFGGKTTETVSLSTQLSCFCADCGNNQLRHALFQICRSKAPANYKPWSHTAVEEFARKPTAVSTCSGCLFNKTCLQHQRRPRDICQPSQRFTNKTQSAHLKSHLCHAWHGLRSSSLSKLNRPQPRSLVFHQTRAVHQAAPSVADGWRDCLSLENENRCRQSLGPNLKFYDMETVKRGASQTQGKNKGKWAAVLVSLCCVRGEPAFLFTLRSPTLNGRHKGDVSFAGGKSDPSDRDVVATALREAQEELGVTVTTEKVWGLLKPLRETSGMMVAPVLANIGPLEELSFKPNPGEVEEIFTLSLSHLCNPQNRGYTHFRTGDKYGYTLPVFRNGKHRVWGLTALALDQTLKLIVPS